MAVRGGAAQGDVAALAALPSLTPCPPSSSGVGAPSIRQLPEFWHLATTATRATSTAREMRLWSDIFKLTEVCV
jgi:hypothetical protein